MSTQPTHHGYAVNVKDRGLYGDHEPLTDDEAQVIYDRVVMAFWDDAELIAHDNGFTDVYAEGRMGGWAVPQPQPHDEFYPHELDAWVKRFRKFEVEILAALAAHRQDFRDELTEAVDKAKREPAERAHWEARDTITVG